MSKNKQNLVGVFVHMQSNRRVCCRPMYNQTANCTFLFKFYLFICYSNFSMFTFRFWEFFSSVLNIIKKETKQTWQKTKTIHRNIYVCWADHGCVWGPIVSSFYGFTVTMRIFISTDLIQFDSDQFFIAGLSLSSSIFCVFHMRENYLFPFFWVVQIQINSIFAYNFSCKFSVNW